MFEKVIYRENRECPRRNVKMLACGEKIEYLTFDNLTQTGIVTHLFSTRLGGVSENELAGMNLSFQRGDDTANVTENYRRIGEVLGTDPSSFVASHQTHTVNIRKVTKEDRGKGVTAPRDYTDIDGLVTNEPGIVLATFFADCVPLYFVDPVKKAIGLAHSGWRGTAGEMGRRMVERMREEFGTNPSDIYAAIGPSICVDCYEVSDVVADQFKKYPGAVVPGKAPGKYQLDLWEINRQILMNAGIQKDRLEVNSLCTCCNPMYLFSHRASQGKRGNLAAFLGLL